MKTIFISLAMLLFSSGCAKIRLNDDNLSIARANFIGKQLRIDGYFYTNFEDKMQSLSFFFENGIFLDIGGNEIDYDEAKNYVINQFINKKSHLDSKLGWGVFKIDNDYIAFERWYGYAKPYKAFVRAGKILNDTTFVITESYRVINGERKEIRSKNEMYHFKKFSPKPDSTNVFVQ